MKLFSNIFSNVPVKLLTVLGLTLAFSSCSDELEVKIDNNNPVPEGCFRLNLSVPTYDIVKTRAGVTLDEDQVNELDIFIFDGTAITSKLISHQYLTSDSDFSLDDDNTATIDISIQPGDSNLGLVVIANAHSSILNESSLDANYTISNLNALYQSAISNKVPTSNGFVMRNYDNGSNVKSISSSDTSVSVSLYKNVSKITVDYTNSSSDFRLTGFRLANAAAAGYLDYISVGGTSSTAGFYTSGPIDYMLSEDINSHQTVFTYPTKGLTPTGSQWTQAFLVLQGTYKNEECYYRIDLKDGETYFDILSNIWYEVEITYVGHKGFTSIAEAIKHPESSDFEYVIHDHVATVYSMTSDGIRELGTSESISMSANVLTYSLSIKAYSADSNDYNVAPKVTVTKGSSWLSVVSNTATANGNTTEDGGNHSEDPDTQGRAYTITINSRTLYTDNEGAVQITWAGLTRTVKVVYDATFDANEACNATLKIYKNGTGNALNIYKYWDFVAGAGSSNSESCASITSPTPRMWGSKTENQADGKVRNEGFHFPMPYGASLASSPWTYVYELDFSPMAGSGVLISSVSASIDSKDPFYGKVNWDTSSNTLSYTGSKTAWDYLVGTITFTVNLSNGESPEISFKLYRTGFFHYDGSSYGTSTNDQGYYYYEVFTLGTEHWLDRNLGAKSAQMFVDNSDSGSNGGNSDAVGRFYTIATAGSSSSVSSVNPTISTTMCPPGYHIPNTLEWDNMRLSSNFKSATVTENGVSYSATYYQTSNGNVYFPKARFYSGSNYSANTYTTDNANVGDAASGYYWTINTAQGLEKAQLGQWLQGLNFVGSSSSYINSSVTGHRLSLRCVAGTSASPENKETISFNVKGATHVYMYYLDSNRQKHGIFSFPGKSIGTQSAVDNLENYYNPSNYLNDYSSLLFSYSGNIAAGAKLYVFFCYVEESGKITIISQNNATTMASATGWEVINDYNYFFYKDDAKTRHIFSRISDKTYYFPENSKVRLTWQRWNNGNDWFYLYQWYDSGNEELGSWGGIDHNTSWDIKGNDGQPIQYRQQITLSENADEFFVIIHNNKNSQSRNIEISENSSDVERIDKNIEGFDFDIYLKEIK